MGKAAVRSFVTSSLYVVSLITDKEPAQCCILALPQRLAFIFLADPANIFPGTNGRNFPLFRTLLAQGRPLAQSRYNSILSAL